MPLKIENKSHFVDFSFRYLRYVVCLSDRLMSDESSRTQDVAAIHQDVGIHLAPLNWYLLATFRLFHKKNPVSAVLDPHLRVRVIRPGIPRQDDKSRGSVRRRKDRLTRDHSWRFEERSSGLTCLDSGICGGSRGRPKLARGSDRTRRRRAL